VTLTRELVDKGWTPYTDSPGGSYFQKFRVTDDAGAIITLEAVESNAAITPVRGTTPTTDPPPAGYFAFRVDLSQPDPKVVDLVVNYKNVVNFFDKDSDSPQAVDRQESGYCRLSTQASVQFVEVWYRGSVGLLASPDATASDPYNVSTLDGTTTSYVGNADSAGTPVSFPLLRSDVSVSLTRNITSDPLPWSTIDNCLGKRCADATFIGFTGPALLFTGARIVETFDTGLVNYELSFVEDQIGHMRQIVDRDEQGVITTMTGTPPLILRSHAKAVRLYQPFPTQSFTGLLSTAELTLLEGQRT
tara:strand:- start:215 stop:1126 length:912 start_codon:yes stop_codon:yes gene_type:complete